MQINSAELTNFRSHKSTRLTFKPGVNAIFGPNGCGKSSVAMGIEYALTGKVPGIDRKDLICNKRSNGNAAIGVNGINVLRNLDPHTLEINGNKPGIKEGQSTLMEELGANERIISAALHATELVDMDAEERASLLFDYLDIRFNNESLKKLIPEDLHQTFDKFAPKVDGGAEVFDRVYKAFYDARTAEKKVRAAQEAEVKRLEASKANIGEVKPEAVQKKLDGLKTELAQKLQELGSIEQLTKAKTDKEARIKKLKDEIDALTAERNTLTENTKEANLISAQLQDLEDQIKEANNTLSTLKVDEAGLKAKREACESTIEALETSQGSCPLTKCSCSDTEGLDKYLEDTKQQLQVLNGEIAEAEQKTTNQTKAIQSLQEKLPRLRQQHTQMTADLAKLDGVNRQLIDKQKALIELESTENTPIPDATTLQKETETLQERIAKGEVMLKTVKDEIERQEQLKKAQTQYDAQCQTCENLEKLVKLFDATGLKAEQMKKAISPLQERMAEVLKTMMPGWRVELEIQNGNLAIWAAKEGEVLREARTLSGSEKWRVSILIADVLNKLCGLGVMVLDEVDRVATVERRKELYECINQISKDYDFILLIGECHDSIDYQLKGNLLVWSGFEFATAAEKEVA